MAYPQPTRIAACLLALALLALAGGRPAPVVAQDGSAASYEIGDPSRVTVEGPARLVITIADTPSLEITALPDDLERIEVDASGDDLEIRFEGELMFDRDPEGEIRYDLAVTRLNEVVLDGPIDAEIGGLRATDLTLHLDGGARLEAADLDLAGTLEAHLAGASEAHVAGAVDRQVAVLTGSSTYRAEALQSRVADIDASDSSLATVRVTEALTASAAGSSRIEYIGEEVGVNADASGGGEIHQLPFTPLPDASPSAG